MPAGIESLAGNRVGRSFELPGGFPGESEVDHLDFAQGGWTREWPQASDLSTLQARYGYSTAHLDGLAFARQLLVTGLAQGPFLVDTTVRGSQEGGNRAEHVINWNLRVQREFRSINGCRWRSKQRARCALASASSFRNIPAELR